MSAKKKDIDYGPLNELIGVWRGAKGLDVAPEPAGAEDNPYFETITYLAIGDVTNAESQVLWAVHYRQIVQRKSNNEIFHDETGYWMWDPKEETIMHALAIPRGVSVLAGGTYTGARDAEGRVMIEVAAKLDDSNWKIIQSPFMLEYARTTEFRQHITVGNGKLSYSETTIVEIYGKVFEHTDQNDLILQ
ncbi:MAG: FABP family protein [Candidatus Marinimicrobia bacterium]|nr:FABP family protein [Candidatus Neomarinimicrobiota bacterium]